MAEVSNRGTPVWRVDPYSRGSGARNAAKKADAFGDGNGLVTSQEIDTWIAHNETIIAQGDPSKIFEYPSPESIAQNNVGEAHALQSLIAKGTPGVAAAAFGVMIRGPAEGLEAIFSRIFKNVI